MVALTSGCGTEDEADAAVTVEQFSATLPSEAPLSRTEIDELKARLADDDLSNILVEASVFAFDDAAPDTGRAEWLHLMDVLAGVRDVALANGWVVIVDGYTDDVGGADYNLSLSYRRAESARAEIVSIAGYPPSEVTAIGRGEAGPQEENRRVVVRFERKENAS